MEKRRPLVAEIKRNSLDDGPGIRSVVFFKGCPLSCVWCHNPECISAGPELIHKQTSCIGCGTCVQTCKQGAITEKGPAEIDREKCTVCGECADECPSGALSVIGTYHEPQELVELLVKDRAFYENSGGGVTLSGGEPTLAMDYSSQVARGLKDHGVHVCIETSGEFDWERFEEKLLPHVDLVYVDLKLVDEEAHKKFTGIGNSRIKTNIEKLLARENPEVLVRTPLVPSVTATAENLEAIAAWLSERGVKKTALLPYNPLWLDKARGLCKASGYSHSEWMTKEERDAVKEIFKDLELVRDI